MARITYTNGFETEIPVNTVRGVGFPIPGTTQVTGNTPPKLGDLYQITSTAAYSHPSAKSTGTAVSDRYYTVPNADGRTGILLNRTGGTGALVMTLETYYEHDDLELEDKDITLAANGILVLGRLSPGVYNYPNGKLYFTIKTPQASSVVNIYAFTI